MLVRNQLPVSYQDQQHTSYQLVLVPDADPLMTEAVAAKQYDGSQGLGAGMPIWQDVEHVTYATVVRKSTAATSAQPIVAGKLNRVDFDICGYTVAMVNDNYNVVVTDYLPLTQQADETLSQQKQFFSSQLSKLAGDFYLANEQIFSVLLYQRDQQPHQEKESSKRIEQTPSLGFRILAMIQLEQDKKAQIQARYIKEEQDINAIKNNFVAMLSGSQAAFHASLAAASEEQRETIFENPDFAKQCETSGLFAHLGQTSLYATRLQNFIETNQLFCQLIFNSAISNSTSMEQLFGSPLGLPIISELTEKVIDEDLFAALDFLGQCMTEVLAKLFDGSLPLEVMQLALSSDADIDKGLVERCNARFNNIVDESFESFITQMAAYVGRSTEVDSDEDEHEYTEDDLYQGDVRLTQAETTAVYLGRLFCQLYLANPMTKEQALVQAFAKMAAEDPDGTPKLEQLERHASDDGLQKIFRDYFGDEVIDNLLLQAQQDEKKTSEKDQATLPSLRPLIQSNMATFAYAPTTTQQHASQSELARQYSC